MFKGVFVFLDMVDYVAPIIFVATINSILDFYVCVEE